MVNYTRGDYDDKRGITVHTANLTFVGPGGVGTAIRGHMIQQVFHRLNITTNLAGVVVPLSGGNTTNAEVLIPRVGSLLGCAVKLSAAMGTGTLDVWPTINGTTQATLKCHMNAATASINQQKAVEVAKDSLALAAFDKVGVKITSSAAFAPVTIDMTAVVYYEI